MNKTELPEIGAPFQGGFYAGLIKTGDNIFAIINAPKKFELKGAWGEYGKKIEGASSTNDCMACTVAMAEAGSELAKSVLALDIDGFTDWAIPSRDVVEINYRNFKPTEQENYCSYRDGDNPSSVPPGHLYSDESPTQTTVEAFKDGGEQAFQEAYYWTSTQYSANYAFVQFFSGGFQTTNVKTNERPVRPVRRLFI